MKKIITILIVLFTIATQAQNAEKQSLVRQSNCQSKKHIKTSKLILNMRCKTQKKTSIRPIKEM